MTDQVSPTVPPGPRSETEPRDPRSLGEIVSDVTTDLSTLMRQEMELAKTELKQEMGKAGKGAGLLGGAGAAGYLFLFFLSLTGVYLLDEWMHQALAALIVTVLWGAVAAVMALTGKKALQESNPQLPRTQQTLKEDAAWARAQKS
ncbi:phage holin family protein [Nocardioides ferulae]|uniref:phage holin family protein n=1 Tax=Nocardioides ferulae TaxID=2340821 RepID=UPI000EB5B6AF|nr:phage holin family protein [Nocardioides ferulae]